MFLIRAALCGVLALGFGPATEAQTRTRAVAVPAAEIALVKKHLYRTQRLSFARNREFCGYLGRNRNGRLVVTRLVQGFANGCTPRTPPRDVQLLASIHTHGAYDRDVPAEFPTTLDMESDAAEGVNGYVATPGGRLWYIDSRAMVAVQLCGLGCLPQDPGFRAGDDGVIHQSYRYDELKKIETPQYQGQ